MTTPPKPGATGRPLPKHNAHAIHLTPGFPTERATAIARCALDIQESEWAKRSASQPQAAATARPVWGNIEGLKPVHTRPHLLASAHGRIDLILLCYPAGSTDTTFLQDLFARFIHSFPHSSFAVLTQRAAQHEVRAFVAKAGATRRTKILIAPDFADFTIWCEDPFQVARDADNPSGPPFLLKPYTFVRGGDDMVADCIANQLDFQHAQLPLIWQGGNVLTGDSFVLVGTDYLAASATLLSPTNPTLTIVQTPSHESAVNAARALFSATMDTTREFIFVGTKLDLPALTNVSDGVTTQTLFDGVGPTQPIFHLDMFVSLMGRQPGGKYRIAVGSPKMADQILGRRQLPQALDAQFDDLAERLARHPDLEVVRSPLPLESTLNGNEWTWYYATACNNIVEIVDEKHKTVWLPQYGFGDKAYLKPIDDYHEKLWRDHGFKVVGLGDYNEVAACFGAAHCLKKILKRKHITARKPKPGKSKTKARAKTKAGAKRAR